MRYHRNFKFSVFIRLITNTEVKNGGDFKWVRIDAIVPGAVTPTADWFRALSSVYQAVALPGGRVVFPAIAPTPDLEGDFLYEMIRQINRCNKKSVYGIRCSDENVVAIERDFLTNSPAASIGGSVLLGFA